MKYVSVLYDQRKFLTEISSIYSHLLMRLTNFNSSQCDSMSLYNISSSCSRDIPGLINCHTLLLSAIRETQIQLLFPAVSESALLLQLVKFTFYALTLMSLPRKAYI